MMKRKPGYLPAGLSDAIVSGKPIAVVGDETTNGGRVVGRYELGTVRENGSGATTIDFYKSNGVKIAVALIGLEAMGYAYFRETKKRSAD